MNWRPILFFLLAALASRGQGLDTVHADSQGALEKALAELNAVRQRIEGEKLPLARELGDLEQRLLDQRTAFEKAERFQENQLVALNALKAQAKARGEEVKYVDSLLAEYQRAFRTRLNPIEEPRYKAAFDQAAQSAANPDLSAADRLTEAAKVLETALERLQTLAGGDRFQGQAVAAGGRLEQGEVLLLGPVAFFLGKEDASVGLVQQELNKADPTVFALPPSQVAGLRQLAQTGTGQIAVDPTLGNALKVAALRKGIVETLKEGGLVMIPLMGLALASVLLAAFKWWQFSRVRVATESDLQVVLGHLERQEPAKALQHARSIPGAAGDLLTTAVEHVDEKKEYIEEVLYEKMLGARSRLERGLPFLALTATTAPLLGLLGTVTGMIATFKLISSFGGGDPKLLASGISEALIATATGMGVAIPALLLHAFLSRKAKGILGSMEQTAVGFVNGIPASEPAPFA